MQAVRTEATQQTLREAIPINSRTAIVQKVAQGEFSSSEASVRMGPVQVEEGGKLGERSQRT